MLGMLPMNKKMASLIVEGGMNKEQPEVVSDGSVGLEAAAEQIVKAIESKDKKMLVSAMKGFVMMCMDEYEMTEGEM